MKHTSTWITTYAKLMSAVALIGLTQSSPARSQEPQQVLAQRIVEQGNGRGAAGCASCHGERGEGMREAGFPRLAGLSAPYLQAQLLHFQRGQRDNPVMAPMAKPLSAQEIEALAQYYASMPAPTQAPIPEPAPSPALLRAGARLVRDGRWADDIPACTACHGKSLGGLAQAFPPLTGQPAPYISAALTQWRSGARRGDPNDLMGAVARRLSDDDIAAVSTYLSTLSATAPKVKP